MNETPYELAEKVLLGFAKWIDDGEKWDNGQVRTLAEEEAHWTKTFEGFGCSERFAFSAGKDAAKMVMTLKNRSRMAA